MDLSSNEGSKEILEDFNDKLVVKTRVSNSNEAFDGEQRVEAMGMYLQFLLCLLFLLLLAFFVYSLIYFACRSCHAVMDIPEEFKAAAVPLLPTTPISTIPIALIFVGPSNFLTLVPSSIKILSLCLFSFFVSLLGAYSCT